MLTPEDLKQALPQHLKGAATQELADKINMMVADPEAAIAVRENFVSYSSVLTEGRFKVEDYLNAVAYVSFKLMGHSNQEAYKRAFPQRYQALVAAGRNDKQISAYVASYNGNKLVNLILEQSVIPAWIMHQDVYQEAIRTQFEMMTNAKSEKVRVEAANSILTHLKKPETKKIELDLGVRRDSGLESLAQTMAELATRQLELIQQGVHTREIAHQRLVAEKIPDEIIDAEIVQNP